MSSGSSFSGLCCTITSQMWTDGGHLHLYVAYFSPKQLVYTIIGKINISSLSYYLINFVNIKILSLTFFSRTTQCPLKFSQLLVWKWTHSLWTSALEHWSWVFFSRFLSVSSDKMTENWALLFHLAAQMHPTTPAITLTRWQRPTPASTQCKKYSERSTKTWGSNSGTMSHSHHIHAWAQCESSPTRWRTQPWLTLTLWLIQHNMT